MGKFKYTLASYSYYVIHLKTSNSKNQSLNYVFFLTSALVISIGVKLSARTLKSFLVDALDMFVKGGLPSVCFITVWIGTVIRLGRIIFLGHGGGLAGVDCDGVTMQDGVSGI